jgi:carbon-monoxide dehydrogenase medium subunit
LKPFELSEPRSLHDALALLAAAEAGARPAAGCTALMLMMKARVLAPTRLVSLRACAELSGIEEIGSELRIGANTTLTELEQSAVIARRLPVIAKTVRSTANVRVRNVATIGGALAHADPHMDLPPVLVALGASAVIKSSTSTRIEAIENLITGYYETTLARDELITAVHIPLIAGEAAAYAKVTSRSADDWPALAVAVALRSIGGRARDCRIVIGAAIDRPTRLIAVEAFLESATLDETSIAHAADLAARESEPINDQHGSQRYKRQLIRVYVARVLRQVLGDARAQTRS